MAAVRNSEVAATSGVNMKLSLGLAQFLKPETIREAGKFRIYSRFDGDC